MALCLAQALAVKPKFDVEEIATMYDQWIKSPPFDVGGTTLNALYVKSPGEDGLSLAQLMT